MKINYVFLCTALFVCVSLSSQEANAPKFGKGLFNLIGKDSSFSMNMSARMQMLGTSNWDVNNGLSNPSSSLLVRRARLKFDGFAYSTKLKYKLELGLSNRGVLANHFFGNVKEGGRIDTLKLVETYRNYLQENNWIRFEKFNHKDILFENTSVKYHTLEAAKIIFCEGFGLKKNPYFNQLPLEEVKGEIITIHAPELSIDFLLKSTLFVLPLGNNHYKVGATFNHKDKTSMPTKEGKEELIEKLKKVLTVPYTIVAQSAGVRPAVVDRKPMVGVHLEHEQLCILNGLGTRGVMIAPTVAKNLFHHLEYGEKLDQEIDIKRFVKK